MLTSFLNHLCRLRWFFLIFILTIPTYWNLLKPGYPKIQDDLQTVRVQQMGECFKDGQLPCRWVPEEGYRYGYPQFEYYGPLPYYLMAVANQLGINLFDAVKFGFILSLILGNFAMLMLAGSLWGELGGFLSAVLYAYTPFRSTDLFVRGAMGESWAFVFIPLVLFAFLRLIKKPNWRNSAIAALSLGALFATHNISSLIFAPFLGLWLIYWLLKKAQDRLKSFKFTIISGVWSVLTAAFFLLPVLLEKQYAHTESMLSGYFNYLAHFVTIKQLLFTSFWGIGSSELGPADDLSFSLSAIALLLGLAALLLALKKLIKDRRDSHAGVILVCLVSVLISLFMTHQKSSFIWNRLPVLAYLQFPWRFLVISNLFISLMAGYVIYAAKNFKSYLLIFFIFLTFLLQSAYFRPVAWFDITVMEKLSGYSWDRQLTISIFDYLPIFAKHPPAGPAPKYPYAGKGQTVSILDYRRGSDYLDFNTRSNRSVSLTLPLYDFPGMSVKIDNRTVSHNHNNELGLINLTLPSGDHHVNAKLNETPIRLIGDLLTFIFAPLAFIIFLMKHHDS